MILVGVVRVSATLMGRVVPVLMWIAGLLPVWVWVMGVIQLLMMECCVEAPVVVSVVSVTAIMMMRRGVWVTVITAIP